MNQLAVTLWASFVTWCWYNQQPELSLITGAYLSIYVIWAIKIDWKNKKAANVDTGKASNVNGF